MTLGPNRLANQWQGNQYYLILENPLERGDRLNFGFRLDTLFGNDWYFTHSFGLFNGAFTPRSFAGLDFPQIFGEVHLPLGEKVSLDIKGGRFYSPSGFEAVQAIKRTLFSFPYAVTYTPFTYLGAMTSLQVGDRFTMVNGAVNGADRWFDQNYHFSYLGGINWNSKSQRSSLTSFMLVGPNQLPFFPSVQYSRTAILPVGGYSVPDAGRPAQPVLQPEHARLPFHCLIPQVGREAEADRSHGGLLRHPGQRPGVRARRQSRRDQLLRWSPLAAL